MNSLKDTNKTSLQNNVDQKDKKTLTPFITSAQQKDLYTLTEKARMIVKATYMVSGVMSDTDRMKQRLVDTATDVLSAYYDFKSASKEACLNELTKLHGLIDLLLTLDSISSMNANVLNKEIINLHELTVNYDAEILSLKNAPQSVSLDGDMFNVNATVSTHVKPRIETPAVQKVSHKPAPAKQPSDDRLLLVKKDAPVATTKAASPVVKRTPAKTNKVSAKDKRHENILLILEQKKDASINDICALFRDCSSKTIQRDLNELIDNGRVLKKGDRRWSTYNLIK